jgi:endonuclease-3 related protein
VKEKMELNPYSLYKTLLERFGNLDWWPIDRSYHEKNVSDPRFEIIVGAILTQNTAWSNVEKALTNLKSKNILDIKKLVDISIINLQNMIKPSGFFNKKAKRLKNLALYLHNNYHDNLGTFFNRDLHAIRKELLSLSGIGPETADSILLYAGNLPIFVVDAYTKRICERLPLDTIISYNEIQHYFERELSKKYSKGGLTQVYNELHALIVILAKNHCKKKPECSTCPLKKYCMFKKRLTQ